MKSVLISIQPKWCELIASGKKTIEVRKTKPKLETPFKCYIYATQPQKQFDYGLCLDEGRVGLVCKINYELAKSYNMELISGKVIGEFVCDKIEQCHILWVKEQPEYYDRVEEKTQLTYRQMFDYLGENGVGYFWHISDLVIYDKPRELSEFEIVGCQGCRDKDTYHCKFHCIGRRRLKRPPQSWCYVEVQE